MIFFVKIWHYDTRSSQGLGAHIEIFLPYSTLHNLASDESIWRKNSEKIQNRDEITGLHRKKKKYDVYKMHQHLIVFISLVPKVREP